MTFLQPFILWALPVVLLPVIIHLINRMRHRPQPWAAMRFLLTATRSSISHQKLRQILILLFRVLAVLALVMFLSRPLAGGWLGWAFSAAPDAILILLDRSASMEHQASGSTRSLREHALDTLARTAAEFDESSHLVLVDSALRLPQVLANASSLRQLSLTSPTDTAADIPAMLQTAVNWLIDNRAGSAEIWIASDLQRSNWKLEDPRWATIIEQLGSLPQSVRVRLLSVLPDRQPNVAVSLQDVMRQQRRSEGEVQAVLDFQSNTNTSQGLPLIVNLDGSRSQLEIRMEGSSMRWRHKVGLGEKKSGGWGSFEAPADANRRDNAAYFVYAPDMTLRAAVVSLDLKNARYFRYAATSVSSLDREPAGLLTAAEFETANLQDKTLILWQDRLPKGGSADRIRAFAEEGGSVVFFPPGEMDAQRFLGLGWGEVQSAPSGKPFRVLRWDENQGPFAKTEEGFSLPLPQVDFQQRQAVMGAQNVLAAFDDQAPFLVRQTLGRGEILFCASLPDLAWSTLGDGPVLVPMLQRLLQSGSRRLQRENVLACGELSPAERKLKWTSVDSTETKDVEIHAGVYQSGDRFLAVNRPAAEDELDIADLERLRPLFKEVPFQTFQEEGTSAAPLQGEFWRAFLLAMLLFLLGEAFLILPAPKAATARPNVPLVRPLAGAKAPGGRS